MSHLPRRARAAGLAVAAVALAAGVSFAALHAAERGGPVPGLVRPGAPDPGGDEAAEVELPPAGRPFGFSGGLFPFTGTGHPDLDVGLTAERTAADAAAAGVNAARVALGWSDLEPAPGARDERYVARMSRYVRALRARGARVLFVLTSTPAWASEDPGDPAAPPRDDPAVTRAFARHAAFVARTWPELLGIETWNEPNADFAWRDPDAARYARLHRAAARAIREVDPAMTVVLAGLAGADGANPGIVRPQRYLASLYAAGLQPDDYDALAVHPYPGQADGRMGELGAGGLFAATMADFRAGFRRRDPGAAVWVTEVGLSTTGAAPVTPVSQARGIVRLVRRLLSMPDVEALFLHTQYDIPPLAADDGERGFGVLVPRGAVQGRPKPAFCALRELAIAPAPFRGCP